MQAILGLVSAAALMTGCNSGSLSGGNALTGGKKDEKKESPSGGSEAKDESTGTEVSTDQGTDVPVWVNGAYLTCAIETDQSTAAMVSVLCGVDDDGGAAIKPDGTKVDWASEDESGVTTSDEHASADTDSRYQGRFKFPGDVVAKRTIGVYYNGQKTAARKVTLSEVIAGLGENGALRKCLENAGAEAEACAAEFAAANQETPAALTRVRMFVLGKKYSGNLGGLAGANARCQQGASAAGLTGKYHALLSTETVDAGSHFEQGLEIIDAATGVKLAEDATTLFSNGPKAPIVRDQNGNQITSGQVWTGTKPTGLRDAATCGNWTQNNDGGRGAIGQIGQLEQDWVYLEVQKGSCAVPAHIYCVEVQ